MGACYFLALSLCFLLIFPDPSGSVKVPGWLSDKEKKTSVLRLKTSTTFDPSRVTQLSWNPRAFIYKGFLSDEECDHLIDLAKDKLEKSMVADNESGKSIASEVRTSSGMFLSKAQDEIVASIEARIAAWTFLPPENGEAMQILHYEHGQKYEPHFDFFRDKMNQQLGGHRIATVLMYLSHVEKGGETVFPNSEVSQSRDGNWSECARRGYAVKPMKGDALLFFSLHPDASTDSTSLHGSCPVIEGEKWSATKWIHVRNFDKPEKEPENDDCVDEDLNCVVWAKAGECKRTLYIWWDLKAVADTVGRVARYASHHQYPHRRSSSQFLLPGSLPTEDGLIFQNLYIASNPSWGACIIRCHDKLSISIYYS